MLTLLLLPALVQAQVWRWTDSGGTVHYSNVPGHVPPHAAPLRGPLGYLSGSPPSEEAIVAEPPAAYAELRQERGIRRRLKEIESFYSRVRARQLERLRAYGPNAQILEDWMVTDRWLALQEEEAELRAALALLERRREPS